MLLSLFSSSNATKEALATQECDNSNSGQILYGSEHVDTKEEVDVDTNDGEKTSVEANSR